MESHTAFPLVSISVTFSHLEWGETAVILRCFNKFGSFESQLRHIGWS